MRQKAIGETSVSIKPSSVCPTAFVLEYSSRRGRNSYGGGVLSGCRGLLRNLRWNPQKNQGPWVWTPGRGQEGQVHSVPSSLRPDAATLTFSFLPTLALLPSLALPSSSLPVLSPSLDLLNSHGCCNSSPQTWWHKTMEIDSLPVLELDLKSRCPQSWFFLEVLKENWCLVFLLVQATSSLWHSRCLGLWTHH